MTAGLNGLALLYRDQEKYAEAEPLFKRSIAIIEQALGPDYPTLAVRLENYAALLRRTGRVTEVDNLEARYHSS